MQTNMQLKWVNADQHELLTVERVNNGQCTFNLTVERVNKGQCR